MKKCSIHFGGCAIEGKLLVLWLHIFRCKREKKMCSVFGVCAMESNTILWPYIFIPTRTERLLLYVGYVMFWSGPLQWTTSLMPFSQFSHSSHPNFPTQRLSATTTWLQWWPQNKIQEGSWNQQCFTAHTDIVINYLWEDMCYGFNDLHYAPYKLRVLFYI